MNRKELVSSVSEEFGMKPGRSRKVVDHVLSKLLESGLSGEGFASPILRVVSKDVPERVVNTGEGQKTVPTRRIMRLVPSQKYVSAGSDKQSAAS